MNFLAILLSVPAPLLGTAPQPPANEGLVRVQQEDTRFDAQAWREKLSARDLERRERAFERLVDRARRDPAARSALEEWARFESDAELSWTARLALRELKAAPAEAPQPAEAPRGGAPAPDARPFRARAPADPFEDMRRRFEALERRMGGLDSMFGDLERQFDRWHAAPPAGPGVRSESQSYSLQVSPDGVKVEIQEDVDGRQQTKTYTGKTLDEILDAHPELRDRIQSGPAALGVPGMRFWMGDPREDAQLDPRALGVDPDEDPWSRPARPLNPAEMRTDILGVLITKPTDLECDQAKIERGTGLKVERAEPGTIAGALGVQGGDILVALNGREIKDREDVAAALRERKPGEDVRVELVDPQGKRQTLTWKEPAR